MSVRKILGEDELHTSHEETVLSAAADELDELSDHSRPMYVSEINEA
jgi:hypothetical protein